MLTYTAPLHQHSEAPATSKHAQKAISQDQPWTTFYWCHFHSVHVQDHSTRLAMMERSYTVC